MNKDQNKIEVKNISKTFRVKSRDKDVALSHITHFFQKENKTYIQVLDDISFDVKPGEVLGIIGRNGSGKSTLLQIIAGVYSSNSGKVVRNGEIFYLTSLGIGIMPKLTMKDNIFLVGIIMGLSQKKIKEVFDDIVDFSELRNFVDMKVSQFSKGMVGRLAFSISIYCLKNNKAEVLLLDEVFGSGADLEFEKKAIIKMEELIKSGTTVILVSHNLDIVEKYCTRVMWLDKGKIVGIGEPKDVVARYKK